MKKEVFNLHKDDLFVYQATDNSPFQLFRMLDLGENYCGVVELLAEKYPEHVECDSGFKEWRFMKETSEHNFNTCAMVQRVHLDKTITEI